VLGPHNVVAVFVGQGEQDLEWRANGLPFLATRGLNQGSYHIVDVKNGSVQIRSVSREDREPKLVATAKLEARPFRRIATLWDDAGISLLERRRILAELRIDEKGAHDDRVTAAYSIDGGPEQPMKRDARDTESVSFMAEFETIGMKHGAHTLQLSFRAPDGELFTREESFVVERLDGVKRRWERPFQAADAILSGVVLGEGLVFGGSLDGSVFAIDPARGRRKWLSDLPGPVHGSPTYSNGMLYLASLDHFVYAFEAKSGKLRWKFDTGGALFFPPEVLGDVVCVPGNRAVFGLDAKTGKALWKQNAGGAHQAQPAASDSAFVVCGSEDTLTCYEAASGAIRWSAGAPRAEGGRSQPSDDLAPTVASPAAGEGRVYFRSKDGVLHAVDGRTGRDVWTARAPDGADKFGGISPLFHGGRIYLGCLGPKNRGDLVCLDADTGNLVWRCSTGAGSYDSSPAMQGPNVVIAALDGTLSWVDAATGKLRFQHRLDPGHCFAIPAADELAVYMSSMNGTVTALELPK
jgi:outer membrane protein assembly factor BamB